ncbi:recoverin-like isoform X1 [Pseudoliparis swirei]|uniref:recoverin-like isoform X1 n=1 Tax=Pseudoliparis swirei TaxID=2059687 RepID=UPI0024BD97F0|nr:recoverin-like isoform X1 [Pseudoliparis swirei]
MGNSKSSALSKELLEELKSNTKYGESELCTWYQSFLKECPTGKISKQQFEGIYASFFPNADPTEYARHVFRSFDTNADGTLDFKEYIVALHLTTGGKTLQKLEWAFALYDVDGNGTISKNEILKIVRNTVRTEGHRPANIRKNTRTSDSNMDYDSSSDRLRAFEKLKETAHTKVIIQIKQQDDRDNKDNTHTHTRKHTRKHTLFMHPLGRVGWPQISFLLACECF